MKEILENHVRENLKNYVILSLAILLGVIIGVIYVNNMNESYKSEINTYLVELVEQLKSNSKINYLELLKKTIMNNSKFIILLVLINFSIWGDISNFLMLGYKGFSIGYSISSAIAVFRNWKRIDIYNYTNFIKRNCNDSSNIICINIMFKYI